MVNGQSFSALLVGRQGCHSACEICMLQTCVSRTVRQTSLANALAKIRKLPILDRKLSVVGFLSVEFDPLLWENVGLNENDDV